MMRCTHRGAADVRWPLLTHLVIIFIVTSSAVAEIVNTTVTNSTLTESTTLATTLTTENVTSPPNATEATTKSVEVPTEIPEAPPEKADVAKKKRAETTEKTNETAEKRDVTAEVVEKREVTAEDVGEKREEAVEKSEVTAEKRDETAEVEKREETEEKRDVTTEKTSGDAEKRDETAEKTEVTAKKIEVTAEKTEITAGKGAENSQEEESHTESASELALQSVQRAVVVKAPKIHGLKSSSGNGTDYEHEDEYDGFEGSGDEDDDDDMEDDDDDHGMMEYEEDEEETKGPTAATSTVAPTSEKPSTTANLAVENVDVELSREATTESSTSTAPAPRRPRHSQSGDADFGTTPPPTAKPRRRRPTNRYKEERRVTYRDGYYPNRSLKRRKTPKERPVFPTTTAAPIETTPDSNLNSYNQVDTSNTVPTTTPIPRSRPKRRKKKVRRQKGQNKPEERQVPAETRTAIEAAAAAAAAESLRSDLLPTASTAVSFATSPTTAGPRSVRQNDADVSIQQSDVNPDGSYSFSYDIVDEGRQSKTEVGGPDGVVSGRYGYIDAKGRAVNTEYTAGPRGFRATGNDIARKMDLSQLGPAPVPPPDGRYSPEYDTYSDPNEDPSYEFRYRTDTASRVEIADSTGDVVGQYAFLDDDGEKHVVKYEAGAEKGFNVRNSFPDNNIPTPLFFPGRGRIPPRGRSSILQHRNGAYRFTAVGPDSRREECSDSANYRRGSYVYLDDKGIQRTVIYEAGPNIGFRIITNPAASIPRCPPSKADPGWQNVPISVGADGPYYRPGFGAPDPDRPYRPAVDYPEIFHTLGSKYPKVPFGSTTSRPVDVTGKPSKPGRRPPAPSTTRPTTYRPPGSTASSGGLDIDDYPILIPDPIPPGPRPPKPTPGGSTQSPFAGSTGGSTVSGSTTPGGGGVTGGPPRGTTRPPSRRPPGGGGSGGVGGGSGTGNRGGVPGGGGDQSVFGGGSSTGGSGSVNGGTGSVSGGSGSGNVGGGSGTGGGSSGGGRPYESSGGGSGPKNPIFDKTFDITTHRGYPSSTTSAPRPTKPSGGGGNSEGNGDGGIFDGGDYPGDGNPVSRPGPTGSYSPRPPPYPYPPFDGYHYSCCRDRIYVDPAPVDRFSRSRPIRTYIQSIDISAEDKDGPGRAENPSVALERHVRDHERHASRRQRSRRRRRRRSVP